MAFQTAQAPQVATQSDSTPASITGQTSPSGNSQFEALEASVNALQTHFKEKTKELQEDADRGKSYLLLGFYILSFMFATVIVMVVLDWKNSNDRLIDKVDALQAQISTSTHG